MAMVSASISIEETTLNEAQALLKEFGMDLSTAMNIFLKQMIYESSFPFSIKREIPVETPNAATKAAIENVRLGQNLSRGFHSVEELMEDLYADD